MNVSKFKSIYDYINKITEKMEFKRIEKLEREIYKRIDKPSKDLIISRTLSENRVIFFIGLSIFIIITVFANLVLNSFLRINFFSFKEKTLADTFLLKALTTRIFKHTLYYVVIYTLTSLEVIKLSIELKLSFKTLEEGQKGSSRFLTRTELSQQYKAIPKVDLEYDGRGGLPVSQGVENVLSNGVIKAMEVLYIDDSPTNNLYVGTTRSGKGELFVYKLLDIYSRARDKASLVVNDPKGELVGSKHILEERGYDVYVLNMTDQIHSMSYNPLELIKQAYMEGNFSEAENLCGTLTHSLYYDPNATDKFWQNSAMSLVTAIILDVCERCINDNTLEKITMYTVVDMISELGSLYTEDGKNALDLHFQNLPSTSRAKVQYSTIKFSQGKSRASVFTYAMTVLDIFKKEEMAKLTSMNSLKLEDVGFKRRIRKKIEVVVSDDENNISRVVEKVDKNNPKLEEIHGVKKIIVKTHRGATNEELRKGLIVYGSKGTDISNQIEFNTSKINWNKQGVYEVSCKVIDTDVEDKPKAIFMLTPDNDKSVHVMPSIFVRQLYYVLSKQATVNSIKNVKKGECDRKVAMILDEFGNMPAIEGMDSIITVSAGRAIEWNMFIQDFAQLKSIYGENVANTIESNCGNKVYILTTSHDTAEKISKEIGEKTIINKSRSGHPLSIGKSHTESIDSKRLLDANELMRFNNGETVIIRTIKRTDNNRQNVTPYPIFNKGKHAMQFRWEYLGNTFDNSISVEDIFIESQHRLVDYKELALDFSSEIKELGIEVNTENKIDILKRKRDAIVEKINSNQVQVANTILDDKTLKDDIGAIAYLKLSTIISSAHTNRFSEFENLKSEEEFYQFVLDNEDIKENLIKSKDIEIIGYDDILNKPILKLNIKK